jgi:hypothetical protein
VGKIVSRVQTNGTPGAPGVPATPARTSTLRALPGTEYVAGGRWNWLQNVPKALPFAFDDLTADFGDDIYERMLFDPQVAACLHTLKAAILADGVGVVPAVTDKADAAQGRAQEIADFVAADLEDLNPSLDDSLWSLADAMAYGNKTAEQVYRLDGGALHLAALKVKERRTTAFVVDAYLNTIGVLGLIPGQPMPVMSSYLIDDPARTPNLLPREKFAILSYWPRDSDPRGTSILRAAYRPWWDKQQTIPEYLKYLAQFAGPSIIATAPESVLPYLPSDADGNPTAGGTLLSVEQQIANQLANFRNGTYLVLPFGATAQPLQVAGDGQAFMHAFDRFDRQISVAILHQTLATNEGQHMARAAATVHQDVLALLIRMGKRAVARMLKRDVFRPLVRYNFGEDAARLLTPDANMSEVEAEDLSPRMVAVAQLADKGLIFPSQLPEIFGDLGLPEASPEDLAEYAKQFAAPPPTVPPPGTPVENPPPAGQPPPGA